MVFRDGDDLVVVDYKTDKDVTEETAEQYALKHHSGQGEVYSHGLSAATGLKVREVAFVYCKAGPRCVYVKGRSFVKESA